MVFCRNTALDVTIDFIDHYYGTLLFCVKSQNDKFRLKTIIHMFRMSTFIPGDDGPGFAPAVSGGRETEAPHSGAPPVPRERLAAGRAGGRAAAPAGLRTARGAARGGEQTPGLHGLHTVCHLRLSYHLGSFQAVLGKL